VGQKLSYRAVFISDVHLGSAGCRADDLADFLKLIDCKTLYLVGDIVDMWRLRGRWHWPESHNRVVKRILKMAKNGTRVLLIPGNHDEHARQYEDLNFGGVQIVNSAVHITADGRRLLITHGDQFDLVIRHARALSLLGGWAYEHLLRINRRYNTLRRWMGLRYWSLAQYVKMKVKSACSHISRFEDALIDEASRGGFHGVVCGHIHNPEARGRTSDADVAYYNCGDWIENCTALVEHDDGALQIIDGIAFVEQLRGLLRTPEPSASTDSITPEALHVVPPDEFATA